MEEIIKLNNISVSYSKHSDLILKNINLDIKEGEMVAILGKSGAGKSTLFNLLLRQLNIVTGQCFLFKKDIQNVKSKDWKRIVNSIGFLSQETNLIEYETIFDSIKRTYDNFQNKFFAWFNILTKKDKQKIMNVLTKLGLFEKSFFRISDLSGGQKQRVEIAKILLKKSKLILADEPTSNLDIISANDVISLLKSINKEEKTTIILNIHDLNLIPHNFDSVYLIKNQSIVKLNETEFNDINKLIQIY
ncbi:ATP-binding cassette domain-containing protein [[Mycoplasma] anseris]|uniref:ATP-binding cassette domain-containing protein n=1 Tax=[Mycoplasma] anseris TaxID=92400 RepID=A0A2Z4NCP0_9BACT|nr:ATP-binding cassette domain-containing protein [[Mycoplasma] anseris]AWX69334.1 ATP-binding cassette domain-containing protein [[Mycoplasma] anseris]